jgi:hypothetical protein
MNKRKSLALSLAVIVGVLAPSVLSERLTTTSVNLGSKATLSSDCYGYTHYPHKSRHFNTTVNVIAETICDGKFVSVETTLSRRSWFIFRESATESASAQNRVKINVVLNCKWKIGDPLIEYIAESVHANQFGARVITRQKSLLKC